MDLPAAGHDPVLPDEVLHHLAPAPGQTVIDCTLGRAGHALLIANTLGPTGLLIGLDADPRNLDFARDRLKAPACQLRLFHANFAQLDDVLKEVARPTVDRILADLGL